MKQIQFLTKGELFKMSATGKTVYVYDGFNRSTKKYSFYKFEDINAHREVEKGKYVCIDFEF